MQKRVLDKQLLHSLLVSPAGRELIAYLNSRIASLQKTLCYSTDLMDKRAYEVRGGFRELEALLTLIETDPDTIDKKL